MVQFDICRTKDADSGLLVICQSDFLDHLPTRFVVPLIAAVDAPTPAERFNPVFRLEGQDYVLSPQYAGTVRMTNLHPVGLSLAHEHERVTSAIDFLTGGF